MSDRSCRITGCRTGATAAPGAPACPPPFVLAIFGASGDLARRKLMPALWRLACQGRLPERFAILGYARSPMSDEAFRQRMREACREADGDAFDERTWPHFASRLFYEAGAYDSASDFQRLASRLDDLDGGGPRGIGASGRVAGTDRAAVPARLYYLATPAGTYESIIEGVGALP